jgi:hypothetical protein
MRGKWGVAMVSAATTPVVERQKIKKIESMMRKALFLGPITRFFLPNLSRRMLLIWAIPLIFISYFGTLACAAILSPVTYDWRYRVISNLISPRNNPAFHWIPTFGITIAGLLLMPFTGYIYQRLRLASPVGAVIGTVGFLSGATLLILASLIVPQHPHLNGGSPRLHEMLGRTSALGIGVGMISFCVSALRGYLIPGIGKKLFKRELLASWILVTLVPLVSAAASECLLLLAGAHLPWSVEIFHALRDSVLWHLSFWEWLGSAAVFLFLLGSALFLPQNIAVRRIANRPVLPEK